MKRWTTAIPENHMSINDRDRAPRLANARLGKCVALGACFVLALSSMASSCRRQSNVFVIALSDNVKTIDPIGSPSIDAASERVRVLMFNSLVKKRSEERRVGKE